MSHYNSCTADIAKIEVGIHEGESSAYRGTVELAPVDSKIKTQVLDVPVFCGNMSIIEELTHAEKRKGNSLSIGYYPILFFAVQPYFGDISLHRA